MSLERLWNGWRAAYVVGVAAADLGADDGNDDDGNDDDGNDGGNGGADTGTAASRGESLFTAILTSGLSDAETHIVHRGERCFAIMNAFPYTSGHVMVLPYREVADLEDLTAEETGELWETVTDAVAVLKRVYRPQGLNVGVNLGRPAGGSISEHLHVHVVPRWTGDANFMTAVAETRTLPEALDHSAEKIRAAWLALHP